jgi:predicted nucleic-acid-binding protein
MISVDTNVLVRMLVDDPGQPGQVIAARALATKAGQVFITQIVQVESVWGLRAAYGLDKKDIIRILEHLLHNQALVLQAEARFMEALTIYKGSKADFSDCLIMAESQAEGSVLFTFDKILSKLPGANLVEI